MVAHRRDCLADNSCHGCASIEPDKIVGIPYNIEALGDQTESLDRIKRRIEIESIAREVFEEYRELFERLAKT